MGLYTIFVNRDERDPEGDHDKVCELNRPFLLKGIAAISQIEGIAVMSQNEWSCTFTIMCIRDEVLQKVCALLKEKNIGDIDNAFAFRAS